MPTVGNQAWSQAPAPPQRTVASTVPTSTPASNPSQSPSPFEPNDPASKPAGLAKYFPGLQRTAAEPPKVVARYRPTWFGLRPNPTTVKPALPTTYMTDARAGLNQPGSELSTLPVALEVPSPKPSTDRAVTPATVEQPITGSSVNPSAPSPGMKPMKPGDDEVNPLPPAIEPGNQPNAVVNPMPEIPAVDPITVPKPADSQSPKSDAAVTAPAPAVTPPAPTAAAPSPAVNAPSPIMNVPAPVMNVPAPIMNVPVPAVTAPAPAVTAPAPNDDKAKQAIPASSTSSLPLGLPEPTVPASYYASTLVAQNAVGFKKHHNEAKVLASPQVAVKPTPQAVAKPVVKPTSQSHPVPTSLSKPSPQTAPSAQSSETTETATTWKRPCFRRLIRKVCGLGEYADPPTAAPH
jgi:hypothetical protein